MSGENDRTPPVSEAERAARTEALKHRGETDIDRWRDVSSLATSWDERASRAASHIPASSSVLDIGCGAMALRRYLKPGCIYTPADVVARSADCLVVDLNGQQFPEGQYDWIAMLGVLEYVHSPDWPLAMARRTATSLLLTYCCDTSGDVAYRRGLGWVNDLTLDGVKALLSSTGWTVASESVDKQGKGNIQVMFVCR